MHRLEIWTMSPAIFGCQYVRSKGFNMSSSASKELCVYSFKTVLFLTRTFQESVKFAEQWNCPACCSSAVFNVIGWMKEVINSSALMISSYAWVCSVIELCWALQSLRSISRHRLTDKHLHLDSIPKTKRHIDIPAVCLHDSWYLKTDDRPHHTLKTNSTRHQTELSSDSRYSSSITAVSLSLLTHWINANANQELFRIHVLLLNWRLKDCDILSLTDCHYQVRTKLNLNIDTVVCRAALKLNYAS